MKNNNKQYWSVSVTTDIVIFTIENNDLRVLLIKRPHDPFKGLWTLPGGFIRENETSQEAAMRILKEKAGVNDVYVEQLFTFDSKKRDPRGSIISIVYYALASREKIKFDFTERTQSPQFLLVKKLPDLGFDHKSIINYAWKRLKFKLEYTNVVYSLLPREFPFNNLQKAYEIILGRKLDKRNFRKKFIQLGLIRQTGKFLKGPRQRPAKLYIFTSRKLIELKKFF